jgi:hypothetical protein
MRITENIPLTLLGEIAKALSYSISEGKKDLYHQALAGIAYSAIF